MNNDEDERQVDSLLSLLALVRLAPRRLVIPLSRNRVVTKEEYRQARISYKKNLRSQTQDKGELGNINGDIAFLIKDYIQALQKYSTSISLNFDHKVYLKRGRTYRKLRNYNLALKDCLIFQVKEQEKPHPEQQILLAKARLLEGQCRAQLTKDMELEVVFEEINKAKECFDKAYDVFNEFQINSFKRKTKKFKLRIRKLEWYLKMQQIKENNRSTIIQYIEKNNPTSEELKQYKQTLDEMLPKVGVIPDNYICGITQEIMIEPAITSAGIAYERSAIETHISLNGPKDPIKRCEIKCTVYECHQLQLVLMDYLEENPWAFEFNPQDDFQNIIF